MTTIRENADGDVRSYNGYSITLNSHWRFWVDKEGDEPKERKNYDTGYASFADACAWVDKQIEEAAKAQRLVWPKYEVLDNNGRLAIARGLHKRSGEVLWDTKRGSEGGSKLYPNIPEIKALLEQRRELQAQVQAISSKIDRFYSYVSTVSYSNLDVDKALERYNETFAKLAQKGEEARIALTKPDLKVAP